MWLGKKEEGTFQLSNSKELEFVELETIRARISLLFPTILISKSKNIPHFRKKDRQVHNNVHKGNLFQENHNRAEYLLLLQNHRETHMC